MAALRSPIPPAPASAVALPRAKVLGRTERPNLAGRQRDPYAYAGLVRLCAERIHISQRFIADYAGVDAAVIGDIFAGRRPLTVSRLMMFPPDLVREVLESLLRSL